MDKLTFRQLSILYSSLLSAHLQLYRDGSTNKRHEEFTRLEDIVGAAYYKAYQHETRIWEQSTSSDPVQDAGGCSQQQKGVSRGE